MEQVIQQWQQVIQKNLIETIQKIPHCHPRLQEAMLYACESGGKRVRPLLVIATSQLQDIPIEESIQAAIALEMIHTYSLIHDDLPGMDNDDYRRGKLTVHKKFDEATAILAGDALLTTAFEVLLTSSLPSLAAVRILAQAAGASGMISGQMHDIASEETVISLQELQQIHKDKTGKLLEAAVSLGLLSMKDPDIKNHLVAFSKHFGLAFQIQNDLQDVLWDETKTGKLTGKDAEMEKNTYPSLMGVERAKEQLQCEIFAATEHIQSIAAITQNQQQAKAVLLSLIDYLRI